MPFARFFLNTNPKKAPTRPSLNLLSGIAFYQIVGGAIGISLAIRLGLKMENEAGSSLLAVLLACCLYSFSVLCGILLLRNARKHLTLSIINQALQVLSLGMGSFAYNYVAGIKIGLGLIFMESWVINFKLTLSSFQFIVNTDSSSHYITLNLLALLLLYLLERSKEKLG